MTCFRKAIVRGVSAVVALLALGAGIASAHTVRFEVKLNAHFTEQPGPPDITSNAGWDYFSGRVSSTKLRCAEFRNVRVYRQVPGDDPGSSPTMSDAEGFWRLNSEDPPNGTYYAKTARKTLKSTSAHTHACKQATSQDVVVVGQP